MWKLPPGMRKRLADEGRAELLEWTVLQVASQIVRFPGDGIALVQEPKDDLCVATARVAALPGIEVIVASAGNEIVAFRNPGVVLAMDHPEIKAVIEVAGELKHWRVRADCVASRFDYRWQESKVDVTLLAGVIAQLLD